MSYYTATERFPAVRREEYQIVKNLTGNLVQYPFRDLTINSIINSRSFGLPTGVSFINLHHCSTSKALSLIDKSLYPKHYIIEIIENTPPAYFLDEYVGSFRRGGHRGNYLGESSFSALSNYTVNARYSLHYHWHLDQKEASEYCNDLFEIRTTDSISALSEYLNYDGSKLEWEVGIVELSQR